MLIIKATDADFESALSSSPEIFVKYFTTDFQLIKATNLYFLISKLQNR